MKQLKLKREENKKQNENNVLVLHGMEDDDYNTILLVGL